MCRIAGILDRTNQALERDVMVMRDAMCHGGPDDAGVYLDAEKGLAFGHRRLSIIDLSAAGHQPMQRDEISLVFNGEIYNYEELRQQLKANGQSFSTNSDTEVIIRAYQQWGTACFGKFRGMFALAIYDQKKGELVLARDHAGIKPLYYFCDGEKLYFASEIRAFKALKQRWQERQDWKVFFLTYGFLPEPVTTLKDVQPLSKGSYKIFNVHTLASSEVNYYQDVYTGSINSLSEAKQVIREELTRAVQRHLVADAPIGLFLSGGIDSSLLTLLAQPFKPKNLHTLSLVFDDIGFSEHEFQQLIIRKTGANHQSFRLSRNDFEESFDDIIMAMDQPSTDGINSYFICKYARKAGLKAVLSGLGADELFGGYPSFNLTGRYEILRSIPGFMFSIAQLAPKDNYRKFSFLKQKDPIGEYLFYRGYFTPAETAGLLDMNAKDVEHSLSAIKLPAFVGSLQNGNRASYLESNLYMQSQLLKDTDSMSMWHSLEVRVPFLDYDLIKSVHRINNELKFGNEQSKFLLIESFKDLLPREIWDRKKQGFVLPFSKWMKGGDLVKGDLSLKKDRDLTDRFNKGNLAWSRYWAYLLSKMPVLQDGKMPMANSDSVTSDLGTRTSRRQPATNVLFLNLTTFSRAGGIEKFNRCFLKALQEIENEGLIQSLAFSSHDEGSDEHYYSCEKYKGFEGNRFGFIVETLKVARSYDQVILGHINLAPVGFLIKTFFPEKKLIVVSHGIEVWQPLTGVKKMLLEKVDMVLSVSNFTKQKLIDLHNLPAEKIKIFPNTIDPFFPYLAQAGKKQQLRKKYGIDMDVPVLFTLSRLSSTEKYKGYDLVVQCLPVLIKHFPELTYIIGGKYDQEERDNLERLINELNLQRHVVLTGYLSESELMDYYQVADVFIMPSKKEGFGIVFLEAMMSGLPVIAGNMDGSTDALRNGDLGTLVDPTDLASITAGIMDVLTRLPARTEADAIMIQQEMLRHFGFDVYKNRLREVLTRVRATAGNKKEKQLVSG